MVVIEDTRQQVGKHVLKNNYFKEQDVQIIRSKLPFGDYALCPRVAVDTKQDIYELAQNIDKDHLRFKAECVGAREHNCQLVILVENVDGIDTLSKLSEWQEPDDHYQMRIRKSGKPQARRIEGARLARACETMSTRYGVQFMFCKPEDSGRIILELLEEQRE